MQKKSGVLLLVILMMFALTACGVPKEKLETVDADMVKAESLYQEDVAMIEKINNSGYEDVQAVYDAYKKELDDIKKDLDEMKQIFNENRDNYSEEDVDKIIAADKDIISALESDGKKLKEEIAKIEKAVAEANASASGAGAQNKK